MGNEQWKQQVRTLHARGLSTNAIARELGVARGEVAPMVRSLRREGKSASSEHRLAGCWVSPGWSVGLDVNERRGWVDRPEADTAAAGLVGVLVARQRSRLGDAVSVCGYLVDTYCLGVKNALGPKSMSRRRLAEAVDAFFDAFEVEPLDAPVDLARHLVWGAVEYARGLGFAPHPDFDAAKGHLEPLTGPPAIGFGCDGRPCYIQGPNDDPDAILATLQRKLGPDGFEFTVAA